MIRRLHDFEPEPEGRDWLDSLSDGDFRRADEVCGNFSNPPQPDLTSTVVSGHKRLRSTLQRTVRSRHSISADL